MLPHGPQVTCGYALHLAQGGSAQENAAIKKVVQQRPAAPANLKEQGLAFALAA